MGFADTVKGFLSGHKNQAKEAIDKGAAIVEQKAGDQHSQQIHTAAEKAKEAVDKLDGSTS